MLNIAIIGFGRIGHIHHENLKNCKNCEVKYVFDLHNILEFDRILCRQEINAVMICTNTNAHYELIIKSLENNLHVFVEKPLSIDLDEIKKCFKLANEKELLLFIAYNRRFDPDLQKIKTKLDNNEIGKINTILTISRDYPYPSENFLKTCNGIFFDCAIHDIDYINWMLNSKPISVFATSNNIIPDNLNNNYDNVIILLKYPNDILVSINLSRISKSYDQRLEIYGQNNEIIKNEYKINNESFIERYKISYINELNHFINLLGKDTNIIINENNKNLENDINNNIIISNCIKSIKEFKLVNINYRAKSGWLS